MSTRNLIVKVSCGLVAAVVIVLIGFLFFQQRQIRQMAQNGEQARLSATVSNSNTLDESKILPPVAEVGREQLASEVDELKYQLDAAEEELDMARGQLADALAREDETSMMGPPGAELQTPEGKKRMRNSFIKKGFYPQYGSLFKGFNLSPEEIDQAKEVLADWQVARLELAFGLGNASLPEEERKNLKKQLVDQDSQKDAALETLLGSDNFQAYAGYEDRSYERSMIQGFNENLSLDDALTADQKASLVETLYNKRKDTLSQLGFDEEAPYGSYMDNFMEINLLVNGEYIKAMEEAGLSESQEKKLKLFLERVM